MVSRRGMGMVGALAAGALVISATGAANGSSGAANGSSGAVRHDDADRALAAGFQATPKHTTRPMVTVNGTKAPAANPYLALVPDPAKIDWAYWKSHLAKQAQKEAQKQEARQTKQPSTQLAPPTPFVHDEEEAAGTIGANDTHDTAEEMPAFGTAKNKRPAVRILGSLSHPDIATPPVTTTEDQGSIPLATDTGIPASGEGATITSSIGDGPFGSTEGQTGDFDFFKVTAAEGQSLFATTGGSPLDSVLAVWSADGDLLDFNDDISFPDDLNSAIRFTAPTDGDYYLMVGGFSLDPLPANPFDSSSGFGFGEEGGYTARITLGQSDVDHYAVQLRSGDVLGGVIQGGSPDITVTRPDGVQSVGSALDASSLYPADSRLPGGGNATFAYVAEEPGWYSVSTAAGDGGYDILLEAYRPGSTTARSRTVQRVFLDFNGERVNTNVWGGPGVRTLSPFSSFIEKWGLTNADRNAVINRIVSTVKENIRTDLRQKGLNDEVGVRVLNSRDNPDPWGKLNVSRLIVGGTIDESGIPTIGISSSIDPGNFDGEDQALVMLDVLTEPPDDEGSLNAYMDSSSDRVKFVGTALGNVISHETGHFVGSFHVDPFNDTANLMDAGGNFALLYGVGDDGVGGTADDPDVDFGEDDYNPNDFSPGVFFTGIEDTLNNSAWGFVIGKG
jgi:hypothetical protein